ncbi:MAG: rod shape-determining protein MreD [Acidobacteriota bacterium]
MRGLLIAGVVVAALTLQTTLAGLAFGGPAAPDLVLIVVVYVGLTRGPVTGVLAGSLAGLTQDALSGGVLGIGGLAKTVVGFLAGVLGTQFIMTAPLPRFVAFVGGTLVHALVFMGLYTLLDLRRFPAPYVDALGQAIGNGFVGVIGTLLIEWVPEFLRRRRTRRPVRR